MPQLKWEEPGTWWLCPVGVGFLGPATFCPCGEGNTSHLSHCQVAWGGGQTPSICFFMWTSGGLLLPLAPCLILGAWCGGDPPPSLALLSTVHNIIVNSRQSPEDRCPISFGQTGYLFGEQEGCTASFNLFLLSTGKSGQTRPFL